MNVESSEIIMAVNTAFSNVDDSKTKVEFIDAKLSSNQPASYKNAYCKLTGKDNTSTIGQTSNLPCHVFNWRGKLPNFKKATASNTFANDKWSSYSKDTTTEFKNCISAKSTKSNELWI